jgi:hypothetical protein
MAVVYLAEDRKHHRQVALKVLRPELARWVALFMISRNWDGRGLLALGGDGTLG